MINPMMKFGKPFKCTVKMGLPMRGLPPCESGKIVCFIGYSDKVPVATSATMNNNVNGTLKFIAKLPDYRKKGIGRAICRAAIEQLIEDGAHIISLRALSRFGSILRQAYGLVARSSAIPSI